MDVAGVPLRLPLSLELLPWLLGAVSVGSAAAAVQRLRTATG